jgi:hypothetical protein
MIMASRINLGVTVFEPMRCFTSVIITIPKNRIFREYEKANKTSNLKDAEIHIRTIALMDNGRNAG